MHHRNQAIAIQLAIQVSNSEVFMTDSDSRQQHQNPDTESKNAANNGQENIDEQAMDPRDLVRKGGYRKHPREIVENPAVTPEMYDEPQESRAGFIREDRDEAE
jgi:hypothetical protein